MKKLSIALACAAIVALANISAVPAAKAGTLNVSGDIGVVSDYIWRGQNQTGGSPAVQGDIVFTTDALEGLSATIWGSNTQFTNPTSFPSSGISEWDFVLDYSGSVGDIGYSVGGIYYTYLHSGDSNFGEVYLGLSYDAVVSPSLTIYYNVDDSALPGFAKGDVWIDLGASGSLAGFDLSATLSYASYASDITRNAADYDDGISLVTLGASKDFTVGDLVVTPSVTATIPVASDAGATASAGNVGEKLINGTIVDNEVVLGVNVAF